LFYFVGVGVGVDVDVDVGVDGGLFLSLNLLKIMMVYSLDTGVCINIYIFVQNKFLVGLIF